MNTSEYLSIIENIKSEIKAAAIPCSSSCERRHAAPLS